jgi:hypothetical protein
LSWVRHLAIACLLLFSLCCGGGSGSSSLASGDGISGTGDFELSKVSLVDESYGTGDGQDFTVSTLAPILVARFSENLPEEPKALFKITLTDLELNRSIVANPGSRFHDLIQIARGADYRDLYVHIPKTDDVTIGDYELKPGGEYHFKVEHTEGGQFIVEGEREPHFEGYLRVKDLTLTYLGDFELGDALVKDGDALLGVASLKPEFLIHSRYDFSDETRGPLDALAFEVSGLVLDGEELLSYLDVESVTSRATKIVLSQIPFGAGSDLDFNVLPSSALGDGSGLPEELVAAELPSYLRLEIQDHL